MKVIVTDFLSDPEDKNNVLVTFVPSSVAFTMDISLKNELRLIKKSLRTKRPIKVYFQDNTSIITKVELN